MIICFDLETTGLDKYSDEIIEVAMVKFDEQTFKIYDTFSTLVKPKKSIPEVISNITGIYDTDVSDALCFEELKEDIKDFIGDTPLLGHNVFFDRGFFLQNGIDIKDNVVIDTFFLANFLCFTEPSMNLEMLCKSFNIEFSGAHRAINDVNATINLFQKLKETFQGLKKEYIRIIDYIFHLSNDRNILYLKQYLLGESIPIEFSEFQKILLKHIGKYKENTLLSTINNVGDISLSTMLDSLYSLETRENQRKMLDVVFDTLSTSKLSVIEAPTGLGKTFAYLIPAILHSLQSGEKVYISTKTKTLQDQLYYKDLEFLKQKLPFSFSYTKLKGKNNYLSIRGFFNEIQFSEIEYEKVSFLLKVALWIFSTEHGELDELNYYGQEFAFLKRVNADVSDISKKDSYRSYEFLYKARQKLDNSDIIVVNHSLVFSDIKRENTVLGKIDNLIIDEAHNIEDSVTESLRQKLTLKSVDDVFNIIEKVCIKHGIKKISFLNDKELFLSNLSLIFEACFSYIHSKINNNSEYKITLLEDDFFGEVDFQKLFRKIYDTSLSIIDFLSSIKEVDFSKEKLFLEMFIDTLKIILDKSSKDTYIKILNFHQKSGVSIECTLLNPGKYLKENIWDQGNSIVLTSATLQIGENFDYIKKVLQLEGFQFYTYETDFNYKNQATLFIPNNLGSIKNNSSQVIDFLEKFFLTVKGRVLTLLTSFNMIRQIYTSLNIHLKKEDIHLYAQSIGGSKVKLISSYLEHPENSILLGTDSFWEGVDIMGDNMKYLVIHKIPFMVPTDPIFQARSSFFQDPFSEYSIPKAIIKLKQGFGRLVRSKTDTGMVILLDDRVTSTKWGKTFFSAFPKDINIKHGTSESLLKILKELS